MKMAIAVAALGAGMLVCEAQAQNLLYNPSFEEVGGPPVASGPRGWRFFVGNSLYRRADDGIVPFFARTGEASIELRGLYSDGMGQGAFQGVTNDVFNPVTLNYFWAPYQWDSGDVTISGWYLIPEDSPLIGSAAGGANAGIKVEFKRPNLSVFSAFENYSISGHTSGEWVQFTLTVTQAQLNQVCVDVPEACDSPGDLPEGIVVIPSLFDATNETGVIFWDDLSVTVGEGGGDCPVDFSGDGLVTSADISAFLAVWFTDINTGGTDADFDDSGTTTSADISEFLAAWFIALTEGC